VSAVVIERAAKLAEKISLSVNRIDTWMHMLDGLADGGDIESSTLDVHMHSARQFVEAAQNDMDELLRSLMDERKKEAAPPVVAHKVARRPRKAVRRG
jgi:hypothetical protein